MAINRDKVEAAAIKLLQQGKYDKAIAELKKLVDDDKNDVRTLLKLGDTWVKVGNKKESIESYERAATIYTEQGFFLKAVAVYKQILRVDAAIPELHLKLAELYQQLGLTSDALQHYQNVAVFHEQQGRPRDALDMLKRMVDLDPDNIASRIKLGQLFAKEGLVAEARQELQSALSFLKQQQRFDDYVRVGENLVQYDPGATDVARELAQIYMQRQQPSVALGKLQLCFKAEPRNVEILALIAQAFLDMQQIGKTVSVFKEMAKIYSTDGQADLARSTWERVLTFAPGDAEAEEALGRGGRPTMVPAMAPGQAGPAGQGAPLAVATTAPPNRPNPEDEQLARLLTETDVYVKYGLKEKAIEHLQKVFALRPEYVPALEKLKNLQQAIGGRELSDTLRRLVSAAESQGHPRIDEWRGELARVASRPAPAPAARSNYSTSGEGEVILVDDPAADEPPADEPVLEDPSGVMRLDDEASGVVPLDSSQVDEPFISSEGEIATLPPDESMGAGELDPGAFVAPQIPRMPTGVMRAPPVPAPAPAFDDDEPVPPMDTGEPIDADAIVRQALQDISAEDVVAAADELLLEAVPADMPPVPHTAPLPVRAPPPDDDFVAESSGLVDDAAAEAAFLADEEADLPTMALPLSQLSSSASSQVGFEDHPSLLTGPGTPSLAFTTAQGAPMATSPTMSVPGPIDDDEIDRLAREAVLDADRKLGDVIEATAVLSPSSDEMEELQSRPELPAEMDGSDFEERTEALIPDRSSDMPTDERPKHGAPAAPHGGAPVMADAFSDAEDYVVTGSGHGEPEAAPVAARGTNGFEGEVSEEFDPSSFDLPADVKEMLRAQSSSSAAVESVSAVLAPPAGSEPDEAPVVEAAAHEEPPASAGTAGKLGVGDKAHGWEGDPANQFFPDELEESEFFIQQDLLDEAREILTAILDDVPDSGRVQWMLARIEAKENGQPEPPAPWEQKLEEQILEEVQAHLQGLGFDSDDAPKPFGDSTAQVSVDEVLSQFRKGVAETVPEEDAATHYELGIAYREMGLHDDAVAEFQIASRAPARAADARFLIGLVRKDQGQLDAAVKAFDDALSLPTATRDQRGAAEYERGVCLEELGRFGEALHAYKAARAHGSAAVDIDRRMRSLIEKVGEGGRGPKNIDYV